MTAPAPAQPRPALRVPHPFTLVSGDFVTTGGMDRANHALASYLARSGHPVRLVTHRADAALAALPRVSVQAVRKPLGSYFLGRWPLRWAGARMGASGGRVVVNGGNCSFPDVNWVHYVHAAYRPDPTGSPMRRLKMRAERSLEVRAERNAIRAARVVVCNSERTRRDVIDKVGAEASRTRVVYYGTDPAQFHAATPDERVELRARLGWPAERPVVMFVGAPGDRRKGFDALLAAWSRLCQSSDWDALLMVVGHGSGIAAPNVQFLGFRSDVPQLLRAADTLVSPTRYEAYGLGVHEALCCGLPALVSAGAGVAERYPPELREMLLPDPNDDADLAARLRKWRADPATPRDRVAPLSDRLRAYTWDDMARDFLTAIGEPA